MDELIDLDGGNDFDDNTPRRERSAPPRHEMELLKVFLDVRVKVVNETAARSRGAGPLGALSQRTRPSASTVVR